MRANITATAVALTLCGSAAGAATVFSQTFVPNTATRSDVSGSPINYVADDFTLSAGEKITDVVWRGFYFSAGTPLATDNFTIRFFSDNGGSVGSLLGSFNPGDAVNRADTGQNFGNRIDYFEYRANLGSGLTLGAGTYWVSIFNDTTADLDDDWAWATNISTPGNGQNSPNGLNQWAPGGGSFPYPYYFELESNTSVVPLPAALPLLLAGLGGLGLLARRRMRSS